MQRFFIGNYIAITAVLTVLVMTVLDVTLINVALPVLAIKFEVSDSLTVWLVTIYQMVITMLLLPVSSIGDKFSYRNCFLTGVVIFTLASACCAASESFLMLVASRAIQGIGAACIMGVNIALTRIIYPREVLGRGLALNAMVIAISTAAGPTIAGTLMSVGSWHWLFIINIPFGICAFIVGKKYLPQNPHKGEKDKFDLTGAIANAITFGLIFYSIGNLSKNGETGLNMSLLALGILTGYLYLRREFHSSAPMLPVDLFRIKLYSLSICTSICSFIAQITAMVSIPFLLMNTLGFSEVTTGLLMTPWPLATMAVSPIAARFIEKHNPGVTAATGMGIYAIGLILILFSPDMPSEWDIAWRMALTGLGFGMYQTPNNIVMVLATPIERSGSAGGMQSTARLIGQTTGATLVSLVFAIVPHNINAVSVSLSLSVCFAIIAGIFSLSRTSCIRQNHVQRCNPT